MDTALWDRRIQDRWQQRGGTNPPKKSARFTKPGPHLRAATLVQAKKRREEAYTLEPPKPMKISYGTGYLTNFESAANSAYATGDWYGNQIFVSATNVTPSSTASYRLWTSPTETGTTSDINLDERFGASWWVPGAVPRDRTSSIYSWDRDRNHLIPLNVVADQNIPANQIFMGYPDASGAWVTLPSSPRSRWKQQLLPKRDPCRADRVSFENCSPAELTALTLLKKMVSEDGWRTYLKYGFVNVQGKSGLHYQIRRGQWHVLVRRQGQKVAELCIGLSARHAMPPTDEVIARMIMAECDEPELWRRANVDTEGQEAPHLNNAATGSPAWRRYNSSPNNHRILERLVA
jgi:hypothetical protein